MARGVFISVVCEWQRYEICPAKADCEIASTVTQYWTSMRGPRMLSSTYLLCVCALQTVLPNERRSKRLSICSLKQSLNFQTILQFIQCFYCCRTDISHRACIFAYHIFDFTCCHPKGHPPPNPITSTPWKSATSSYQCAT